MFIELPTSYVQDVTNLKLNVTIRKPEQAYLAARYFQIDLRELDANSWKLLYTWLQTKPDTRTIRSHMNAYKKSKEQPSDEKYTTFRAAAGAILDYLTTDTTRGWIYRVDEEPTAALLTGVEYVPPRRVPGEGIIPACILIEYVTNNDGTVESGRVKIGADAQGNTVEGMLLDKGWQKETAELNADYDEALTRYANFRPMYGKQFTIVNNDLTAEVDDEDHRGWGRRTKTIKLAEVSPKIVHNLPPKEEGKVRLSTYRRNDPDNPYMSDQIKAAIEKNAPDKAAFTTMPRVLTLQFYHLARHTNFTAHINHVAEYVYKPEIREKLILPGLYGEVLDVLTSDMLLIQDDFIEGKAGGNVIALCGPPGTGKTSSAEVYAEFRKVPLLKIHSGQLGTDAETIEKCLTYFYKLASSWGCPILLDEFDVFGRARGNDLRQNAVVAVFLRTLEYQKNTIFLTTNRADDMDDAILSRCQAIVRFEYPAPTELHAIWQVQRDQFMTKDVVTDAMIDELMAFFVANDKKMSGRDVKQILQLANRYHLTGKEITVELLKVCAGFRGV